MSTIAEKNLERIRKSTLPTEFVLNHNGAWDHQAWLDFCSLLEDKGYTPVDLDQVGLILEQKKAEYWQNKAR